MEEHLVQVLRLQGAQDVPIGGRVQVKALRQVIPFVLLPGIARRECMHG